ncbi:peptidase G2 autoproteolytic cleavage domain-containing protein [Staphylococcus saprophyticus]|uniref:Major teichoic acid biosynthesis protein C n=1 Tax=Staphylococcus saprophyticus TaxID=29385 RepID=A0A380HME0_STASA|nr:peptidase G2 autoproteolytic cleavage domain-containing protein [Staphylococcus saprophyticus]SUM82686.1 Putative major teichoic acid biosynthesis protein C [Staphylococcus saprophyticus]
MKLKLNLPIELGQKFRNMAMNNFKDLQYYYSEVLDIIKKHQTKDEHAHNAKQIDYKLSNIHDELTYQDGRIEGLVIGHNGDGVEEVKDSRTSLDGQNHNVLSKRLKYDFDTMNVKIDDNYKKLNDKIERIINVNDYGADPTGEEDSTEAFKQAFGNGGHHVHMTEGTYIVSGLKLPSNTILSGEGRKQTLIKLNENAPHDVTVIGNKDLDGTAHDIQLRDFKVDGNKFRQGGTISEKNGGGSRSSNIRFAGVTHGYIDNIESVDAILHSFDITYASEEYFNEGDGVRVNEELESKYIRINNCEAWGYGDDGITTHHSRYLVISDNYCHHPKPLHGNCNGIEIDDGTRFSMVYGNVTEQNYQGVEVKAHGKTSAPDGILVDNHLSIEENRSYQIRHLEHHRPKENDPISKTAHGVILSNLIALYPYQNGVNKGNVTSKALVINAYDNVIVSNFTAIGDGRFTPNTPAIAVQFSARNVKLDNINISGFKNASSDIKIYGRNNSKDHISLSNINIADSSVNYGIVGGGGLHQTSIHNINLQGSGKGIGLLLYNNSTSLVGAKITGYEYPAKIYKQLFDHAPTMLQGGLSAATTGGSATNRRSIILAGSGKSYAYGKNTAVIASNGGSTADGIRTGVFTSTKSATDKDAIGQTIVNSYGVKANGNHRFQMGYGRDNTPSTENITIDMSAISGNIWTKGTVRTGQDFGDYAEYFESQSGEKIPNGYLVTLDGRYIRKANINDKPIGVISGTAGVVLGDQLFYHKDKFLKDEFGVTLTETRVKEWYNENGELCKSETELPIPNTEWESSDEKYLARSERPEWNVVGLVGQVYTRIDSTVSENDYIKPNKGIGTKDNNNGFYRVLEITTPYNSEKGYGVAVVLIK